MPFSFPLGEMSRRDKAGKSSTNKLNEVQLYTNAIFNSKHNLCPN